MSKPTEKPAETTTEATEILWNYYKALSEPDNGKGFAISWFYTGKENEKDKPEPAGFKKWDSLNELTKAFLADDVALKKLKDAVEAADKINDDKIEEYCKLYNKKNSPEPNDSQKEAIRLAINNPITIVQGPPGTGKTETIKNLLICLRKHNEEAKIAMVSSNNHAVENLEEKIKECDCLKDKYARLGAKDLRQKFADNHPDYEKDDKLRFNSKLLDKFPIILSTIHSLRKCVNFDNQFDHVIVDECSQVSTRLGLLAMASAKHLVLFGDEKQLSPIHNDDLTKQVKDVDVIEEFIGEYYLDIGDNSFMHACSERFGDTAAKIMLNEHYRCHPKIIDFCNQIFYGGDLKIKTQGKGFPIRIRWYEGDYWERIYENKDEQNSSQDSTSDYKSSNYNMKQIEIFVEEELPLIIRKYNEAKKNNSEYSMCVLSPYKDQIKKLKEKLSDGETLKNLCEKIGLPTDEQE